MKKANTTRHFFNGLTIFGDINFKGMNTVAFAHDRQPAIAGQFYPEKPVVLDRTVSILFRAALPKKNAAVRAIICPHAGYEYPGLLSTMQLRMPRNTA